MRTIVTNGLLPPIDEASAWTARRQYNVHLGNGRRVAFDSLREARAFHAEVQRMLNRELHEVNALLGDAHRDYRAAWPLMAARSNGSGNSNEEHLRQQLHDAAVALDRAVHARGPNSMHFAWKALGAGAEHVADVFDALARFYAAKTQGVDRWRCERLRGQCRAVCDRLAAYGLPMKN